MHIKKKKSVTEIKIKKKVLFNSRGRVQRNGCSGGRLSSSPAYKLYTIRRGAYTLRVHNVFFELQNRPRDAVAGDPKKQYDCVCVIYYYYRYCCYRLWNVQRNNIARAVYKYYIYIYNDYCRNRRASTKKRRSSRAPRRSEYLRSHIFQMLWRRVGNSKIKRTSHGGITREPLAATVRSRVTRARTRTRAHTHTRTYNYI